MQFRAFRMPVTLATIMKIYKNTDQECHNKIFPVGVLHLKLELLMIEDQELENGKIDQENTLCICIPRRQYLFVNPLPYNYGRGEPNLHILQVSLY